MAEGGFTGSGHFVRVPDIDLSRCIDLWRDKIFNILLREEKIGEDVVDSMRHWEHSGFSIDNSASYGKIPSAMLRSDISKKKIENLNKQEYITHTQIHLLT